jgi:hypothetical protein
VDWPVALFHGSNKMINIKLDISDTSLSGKYSEGGDVLVELDGSKGTFSVDLPDLTGCGDGVFMFKNTGAATVTLRTVHGQIIDYPGVTTVAVAYKQFFSMASNRRDKWISLETNP